MSFSLSLSDTFFSLNSFRFFYCSCLSFPSLFIYVAASWRCGYQKYMFGNQFKSRMASVGQCHYFLSDIHPLNSENLTYHATLASLSSSFLSIVVVPLYRCPIHGTFIANNWAGALMQKPYAIWEFYGPMDRWMDVLTQQGVGDLESIK